MEIAPGAHHFPRCALNRAAARRSSDVCRALVDGAVPAYVPIVRGGGADARQNAVSWPPLEREDVSIRVNAGRLRRSAGAAAAAGASDARAGDCGRGRDDHRAGSLHPQLLRCRRQDGTAPGQGRRSRIDCGGHSGRVGVDRRHRAFSVRRAQAARSGRRDRARIGRRVRVRRARAAALSRRVAHHAGHRSAASSSCRAAST